MAFTEKICNVSVTAGEDMSNDQYKAVVLSSGDAIVTTDGTNQTYGVLQNDPASGETATVCIGGICKAEAGEAIAIGDRIAAADDGQFITEATAVAGEPIVGIARTAAGAAGEVFSLDFRTYLGTA